MTNNQPLPSIEELKTQAKRLRDELSSNGSPINHSKSLEILAHQFGYSDWNTLHGVVGNQPPTRSPFNIGDQIKGTYLSQPFKAEIIGVQVLSGGSRFKITIKLDEAVDVVTFDSFSAFRQRITAIVGRDGKSEQKTSNGIPQLVLAM